MVRVEGTASRGHSLPQSSTESAHIIEKEGSSIRAPAFFNGRVPDSPIDAVAALGDAVVAGSSGEQVAGGAPSPTALIELQLSSIAAAGAVEPDVTLLTLAGVDIVGTVQVVSGLGIAEDAYIRENVQGRCCGVAHNTGIGPVGPD